ncbi:MAG: DUF302 domain-containing protein [Rhodomicrobium sp.]
MAADGLLDIISKSGFQETITRLKEGIASRGLTLFAVIDHAKGAEEAGLVLRPTTVLIFGNAKGGTPLMQANQTVGLDLPLRALVWEDGKGQTWISYNDPVWLAQRHALPSQAEKVAETLRQGLESIVKSAAGNA